MLVDDNANQIHSSRKQKSVTINQFSPLLGVLLFLTLGIGVRALIQLRRHGGSGIVLFRGEPIGRLLGMLALVPCTVLVGEGLLAAFAPDRLTPFGQFLPSRAVLVVRPVGLVLLFGGTALMFLAQLDLGASWRIGIDHQLSPGLVTTGIYQFCRNPIFLFMFAAFAGFALLVPSWLSLAVVVGVVIGFRHEVVHVEEPYLLRTYRDEYRAYAARVGRFLPRIGRFQR